ncbi:hypothetical protein K0M31_004500 [Melipona bicolor]|uniref:Uncharacterized protein n=1 Tax=Melipona bicolor TaxID=60889 RepID=A0AA40FX76_9HYME|nr:hypothetical protein K0M31_004500 [Melipona bicolor]
MDGWMDGWIDEWVDGGLVNDERDAERAREKVGVEEATPFQEDGRTEGGEGGRKEERRRLERLCFKLVTPWINRQVLESA